MKSPLRRKQRSIRGGNNDRKNEMQEFLIPKKHKETIYQTLMYGQRQAIPVINTHLFIGVCAAYKMLEMA